MNHVSRRGKRRRVNRFHRNTNLLEDLRHRLMRLLASLPLLCGLQRVVMSLLAWENCRDYRMRIGRSCRGGNTSLQRFAARSAGSADSMGSMVLHLIQSGIAENTTRMLLLRLRKVTPLAPPRASCTQQCTAQKSSD